ncbi:hypothetical protein [Methanococcoides sp. AM1]|uniref:DUF7289 family protein n=1 Tax=Methanococcoides sp. AM1 TaxID=1201011 RepID=UPI001083D883|nr:hypothetical protein [Methanococcoides sp. AM1]
MGTKQRPFDSCKAVSSVVGLLLMYSLAIVAVGIILVYNVPVLNDMQDNAKAQKVEQAFTVMDSRMSKVALGESPRQTTSVSLMGGGISVNGAGEAERGTMTIQIINTTTNMKEEFNCSLGTVEYVKDDRKIAYEGGGVWSDYGPKGGTVMVSPPEFHYNGVTLTLPIMTVNGNSTASGTGNTAINVISDNHPYVLYPNTSLSVNRTNPTEHLDKVIVYIKSDYYKAWANYANSMTYTSTTLDDENKTAIVSFTTQPPMGTQPLTSKLKVGQVCQIEHPVNEFNFYFEAVAPGGLNPDNYAVTAISGTRTLSYDLQKKLGNKQLYLEVTYEDTAAGSNYIEKWKGQINYPVNGSNADQNSTVDFTNDSFMMEYIPPTKDGSDPDFSWPDDEIDDGNVSFSIDDLTQHYFKLMTEDSPIVFNIGTNTGKDPVDYSTSEVTIDYCGLGNYITYLHITQNELDVTVE